VINRRLVHLRGVLWSFFHSVFPFFYNESLCMLGYKVGDEASKLRGRKSNGRRGKRLWKEETGKEVE